MVGATELTEYNVAYAQEQYRQFVCVFVGTAAGISRATLERLPTVLYFSTFYILGRNK
jgi:hypothetical protein